MLAANQYRAFCPSHLMSKNVKVILNKGIVLHEALYGRDTWSLTLWEEYRLRAFEKRAPRMIFMK
jgi:hypothetical protein